MHIDLRAEGRHPAEVPDLTSHLAIERRTVKDYVDFTAVCDRPDRPALLAQSDDRRLKSERTVAKELRCAGADERRVHRVGVEGMRGAGLLPLPFEGGLESVDVDAKSPLPGDLRGQLARETVGVVHPEDIFTREGVLSRVSARSTRSSTMPMPISRWT